MGYWVSGLRLVKVSVGVSQRVPIATVGDIPDGSSIVVELNQKDVAVFLVDGKYFAIDDRCPHAGASLSGGFIEDGVVTCPFHHWRFRLSDGAWCDNPKIKTGCYPVHVVGDEIQVEIPNRT